jgi:hypothetical protein
MIAAGLALCLAMALMPLVANAATEAQKQAAIDKALVYLAGTQQGNGSWTYGSYNYAATGAVLLAFEGQGFTPGTNVVIGGHDYGDVAGKAVDYLLNGASRISVATPTAYFPLGKPAADTHGANGYALYWPEGGEEIYTAGIVLTALANSNVPLKAVIGGTEVGRTLKDVVGDAVDYFTLSQVSAVEAAAGGNAGWEGGWRYSYPSVSSDGSTSQWGAIALEAAANKMGVTAPVSVAAELKKFVKFIQNADGGSDYDKSGWWGSNEARTGGLLVEMKYADSGLYTPTQADVAAAIDYLEKNWQNLAGSTGYWNGNFGHPYAMWSIYKGLQGMIGVNVGDSPTDLITYGLDPVGLHDAATGANAVDNPNHGWNWWEDYCDFLVNSQSSLGVDAWGNLKGYWSGYGSWGDPLSTAWYTNILLATEVGGPVVPEPLTCGALMLGLGGLVGYIRRRRMAA